ncbi:MAG: hypothetical protein KC505_09840 [Myxococcales bacterium]|nr:hypothetical protein [Myxococcales bacterium]USN51613.1 MAG: hypothetical protein H6731_04170 [Myxococcales bacterium]
MKNKIYFFFCLIFSHCLLAIDYLDIESFSMDNLSQRLIETVIDGSIKLNQFPDKHETALKKITDLGAMLHYKLARPFNFSICEYDVDNYLLAVRFGWIHRKFENSIDREDKEIVPGNDGESQFEKGKNFWWQNWMSERFDMATMYFLADKDFKSFELLFPMYAENISNHEEEISKHRIEPVQIPDLRVFRQDNEIYVSFFPMNFGKSLYKVKVINNDYNPLKNIEFSDPLKHENFYENFQTGLLVPNLSPIRVNKDDRSVFYLNWFDQEKGIKFCLFNEINQDTSEHYLAFKDKKFIISGEGSTLESSPNMGKNHGKMPLFSFGTPHVSLGNKLLGVGHIKIQNNREEFTYEENSNIDRFRAHLDDVFKDFNYVRCDAFYQYSGVSKRKTQLYLMYFYVIDTDEFGKPKAMTVSDAFLPLPSDPGAKDYIFSLIFPMGVSKSLDDENKLLISAGYGDYESFLMSIHLDDFMKLCRHDLQQLDLSQYEYKILPSH